MKPSTEKEKESCRKWYRKNRKYKIAKSKQYQKDNNYACEKTEKQREVRYIKRKTRSLFPITNQKCKCGFQATEHHHTTNPIEFDKFIYVCHKCHLKEDLKLNTHSKVK